jgi:hypothetical protein
LYFTGIRAVDTAFLILLLVSQNWDLGSGHRHGNRWRTRAPQVWSWSVFGTVFISFFFGAYYWGGWYTVFESSGCKHAGVCQLKAGFVAESMMT